MAYLRVRALITACAALLFSTAADCDPLHAIGAGAFQHHDSGWIFPQQVAGFVREGAPQDVDGSSDATAHYSHMVGATRVIAHVDVYPPDSAAAGASLQDASAALAVERGAASPRSERPFEVGFKVGEQCELIGVQVSYPNGSGSEAAAARADLYFIDTGGWIIKIHVSSAVTDEQALARFVREQRWDSLALSDQSCTGPACVRAR